LDTGRLVSCLRNNLTLDWPISDAERPRRSSRIPEGLCVLRRGRLCAERGQPLGGERLLAHVLLRCDAFSDLPGLIYTVRDSNASIALTRQVDAGMIFKQGFNRINALKVSQRILWHRLRPALNPFSDRPPLNPDRLIEFLTSQLE